MSISSATIKRYKITSKELFPFFNNVFLFDGILCTIIGNLHQLTCHFLIPLDPCKITVKSNKEILVYKEKGNILCEYKQLNLETLRRTYKL